MQTHFPFPPFPVLKCECKGHTKELNAISFANCVCIRLTKKKKLWKTWVPDWFMPHRHFYGFGDSKCVDRQTLCFTQPWIRENFVDNKLWKDRSGCRLVIKCQNRKWIVDSDISWSWRDNKLDLHQRTWQHSWPALSQFEGLKICRSTNFKKLRNVMSQNLKLQNYERDAGSISTPRQEVVIFSFFWWLKNQSPGFLHFYLIFWMLT